MAPKVDPSQLVEINLRVIGGEPAAASSLAPKIGPLGLSPKKVGDDIADATKDWKGLKVTVKLAVQNRKATVSVVPSAAALIVRALKEPPRPSKKEKGAAGRKHNGNISFDDVIVVTRAMRAKSLAATPKGTAKEVLGTCVSLGCTVEKKSPKDIQKEIDEGKWDEKFPKDLK